MRRRDYQRGLRQRCRKSLRKAKMCLPWVGEIGTLRGGGGQVAFPNMLTPYNVMKFIPFALAGVLAVSAVCATRLDADVADDYWSPENMAARQCTSVHLWYLPQIAHSAAYQEMVVEKSAPGTYFAANCFSRGYIGVQELNPGPDGKCERIAIFSVWDAKESGDNPHAAAEEDRAKLVQRGEGVVTQRFGGEGTGGKSMRLFPWKEGDVIRTLVVEKPDGEDFRQVSGYLYNPETKKWELLSCWRIQALSRGLKAGSGFVEDFRRNVESKTMERRATFGPAFRWTGERWDQATAFRFTKDGNLNMNINCRLNPKLGYFSLGTGGNLSPEKDFPVFAERKLTPLPAAQEPGSDVMEIITAPKLEAVEYQDNGSFKN